MMHVNMLRFGSIGRREITLALGTLALIYALLAGLRLVADFDAGWQLTGGRYIVTQHSIPSVDVFSYLARGKSWIYPPLSGVLLYATERAGGFAALSWLNAIACAATVLLMLRRGSPWTAFLAILAIPSIALRTQPRAELFTTVLFAALLRFLWDYHHGKERARWLLPLLFCVWANLHLGFTAGMGLLAGYTILEVGECIFPEGHEAAWTRLRGLLPWIVASAAATLINPWGPLIYRGSLQPSAIGGAYGNIVGEWHAQRVTLATIAEALRWREPGSSYWWLLFAAAVGIAVAIRRRQFGSAVLLAGAGYLSVSRLRYQALFAIFAVVIAGALLDELQAGLGKYSPNRWVRTGALAAVIVTVAFTATRVSDLVTQKAYLRSSDITLFGAGTSWWMPERAAQFILDNRLPANLWNDYNNGGYLMWKLGAEYPVSIDSRALPYGLSGMAEHAEVSSGAPDSPAWKGAVQQWNINFVVLSIARYAGLEGARLPQFCRSKEWALVYMDDVSALFLRRTAVNDRWIQRFAMDCSSAPLVPGMSSGMPARRRAELYNFYANAGAILYVLERDAEALQAYDRALQLFPDDPGLHTSLAQLFQARKDYARAEAEFRRSLDLRPTSVAYYGLGTLLTAQQRYDEAAGAFRQAADLAFSPIASYRMLGAAENAAGRPRKALEAYDDALHFTDMSEAGLLARIGIYDRQAAIWAALGDFNRAIETENKALVLNPMNPELMDTLARFCEANGEHEKAAEIRRSAEYIRERNRTPHLK